MQLRSFVLLATLLVSCISLPENPTSPKASKSASFWHTLVDAQPPVMDFKPGWSYSVEVPQGYLQELPPAIRASLALSQLTWLHRLERPRKYDKGVLGKRDDANFFVALKKDIPDYKRLYWVMVRVLSKEYGCFMRGRFELGINSFGIVCRDKRLVVFHQAAGTETIEFNSRQYDRTGHELIVRNRKVIRKGRQGVQQLLARKRRQDKPNGKVLSIQQKKPSDWRDSPRGRAAAVYSLPSENVKQRR